MSLTESFTGTGDGAGTVTVSHRHFNVSVSGFGAGRVSLRRSFDDGSTWQVVGYFTAAYEGVGYEEERGVLYKFTCDEYSSGTLVARLGLAEGV